MEKKYYIGNKPHHREKELNQIKCSLYETGLINEGIPTSMIAKNIETSLTDLTPENILDGVEICGVKGTLKPSIDYWTIDEILNLPKVNKVNYSNDGLNVYYTLNGENGIYNFNKSTKKETKIWNENIVCKVFFETSKNILYIAAYNEETLTSSIICVKHGVCTKVYESSQADFSKGVINFHESKLGYCYFAAGYSNIATTMTGIYFLDDDKPAKHIYGAEKYESKNGYYWRFPFEDSKNNVYASASSGTGVLQALIKDVAIPVSGATSLDFDHFREMSNGDIYFWSEYNLISICYLDNINYTATSLSYGWYWTVIEDKNGNVYAAGSSSSRADFGILKLNKAEPPTRIFNYHKQWTLVKDKAGNVYARATYLSSGYDTSEKYNIYRLNFTNATPWINIHSDFSFFNDVQGNLYISYAYSSSTHGTYPNTGMIVNNYNYSAAGLPNKRMSVVTSDQKYTYLRNNSSSSQGFAIIYNGKVIPITNTYVSSMENITYKKVDNITYIIGCYDPQSMYYVCCMKNDTLVILLKTSSAVSAFYEVYTTKTELFLSNKNIKKYIKKERYYKIENGNVYLLLPKEGEN